MSINLAKSRTVFFPEIPSQIGKSTPLYQHFLDLQDEMVKQVVGLFDNDAVLRDALNTAVSVAVTATGDIVYATGDSWGVLPIGSTGQRLVSNGSVPVWSSANPNIVVVSGATTGALPYFLGTTGWTPLAAGSQDQQLVYSTSAAGPTWATFTGPSNAPTATDGKMLVSSGSAWVTLAPGATGDVLTMTTGRPQWIAAAAATGGWEYVSYVSTSSSTSISISGISNTAGAYKARIRYALGTDAPSIMALRGDTGGPNNYVSKPSFSYNTAAPVFEGDYQNGILLVGTTAFTGTHHEGMFEIFIENHSTARNDYMVRGEGIIRASNNTIPTLVTIKGVGLNSLGVLYISVSPQTFSTASVLLESRGYTS